MVCSFVYHKSCGSGHLIGAFPTNRRSSCRYINPREPSPPAWLRGIVAVAVMRIHLGNMTSFIQRQLPRLSLIALLLFAPALSVAQTPYQGEIQRWRQDYESKLKAEDGWLAVAGLYWLKEGINTFGTDAS